MKEKVVAGSTDSADQLDVPTRGPAMFETPGRVWQERVQRKVKQDEAGRFVLIAL